MNKYATITLFLIILSAVIYFGIYEAYTQHYNDGEISFNYPLNWYLEPGSNPSQVALFQPGSDSNVTVNKQVIPPGYKSLEDYILNTSDAYKSGFRLLSHKVKIINMNTAYENTYYINSEGKIYLRKEVWIPKNGNLYSIIYTFQEKSLNPLPEINFDTEIMDINQNSDDSNISSNQININYFDFKSTLEQININQGFETIVGNFDVKSVLIPAKTPFWGDISIPALNVDWGIRSDSVNGYNSTYHYNESFYPAQNGTMGLLGHHTLYSAPFAHIDQLKPGDEIIINDYLTQKKYIYKVVSNGDIKWDYKTNPIKFPEGNTNLYLVTCYPPGTTNAAWIVHCNLSSIEIL